MIDDGDQVNTRKQSRRPYLKVRISTTLFSVSIMAMSCQGNVLDLDGSLMLVSVFFCIFFI